MPLRLLIVIRFVHRQVYRQILANLDNSYWLPYRQEMSRVTMLASDAWMRPIQEQLGKRLKQLREEQKLTVPSVAALVGVGNPHIYNIEAGKSAPSFEMLVALSMVYKVEIVDLFVFPGVHPRHDVRELARLTPVAKLDEARAALEAVVGAASAQPRRKKK